MSKIDVAIVDPGALCIIAAVEMLKQYLGRSFVRKKTTYGAEVTPVESWVMFVSKAIRALSDIKLSFDKLDVTSLKRMCVM